ncbi:MAG: D-alanine--D-alanine ligase [Myxococcales bacterium]|nr:D-alanine--D-alanine ligase [Myxococcales bacterium]
MVEEGSRVGVLLGGLSTEREISLKTGASVAAALRRRGWDVEEIDVGRDLPAKLVAGDIDVAWIALHGRFGEDGCVQGLLEVMGIPYTGSDVRSSAVAMDKLATKRALRGTPGVTLAKDVVVVRGGPLPHDVGFPVVVKPLVGGSTIGISLARDATELQTAVAAALALHPEVLLEQFVAGEEITVSVIDGQALPVVRIVPESGFFDFEAKYTKGLTRYEVPAPIDAEAAGAAQRAAVAAYRLLGCGGLARADFILGADGVPVFLEINTLPGMTETSLAPMAAGAAGMSFEDLTERILLGATCMPSEVQSGQS